MKTIVHQHIFKCGGTTLANLLAKSFAERFRCIERREGFLSWDDIYEQVSTKNLHAVSSHTLKGFSSSSEILRVCFVREPTQRLISAWKFETRRGSFVGSFEDYLKRTPDNVQALFFDGSASTKPSFKEIGFNQFRVQHREWRCNTFLGIVDRYDESLCALELFLKRHEILVDLSYGDPLNKAMDSEEEKSVPYDLICDDLELYDYANRMLDLEIEVQTDFGKHLEDFKSRCEARKNTFTDVNHYLIDETNWVYC